MHDQQSSKHIVSVVGPTATGKTAVTLALAQEVLDQQKWQGVTIISADSRQVYKGLEICTGVDLPEQWQEVTQFNQPCFRHPNSQIFFFGTSIIEPTDEWAVAHFCTYAKPLIQQSLIQNFLVLIVGGTGLYQEHLFSTDPLLQVPPDSQLREEVALLSLSDLQKKVEQEAKEFWLDMNYDDRQNSRRLVRALEKARAVPIVTTPQANQQYSDVIHLTVGLTDTLENLSTRITQRVQQRLEAGAVAEVEKLVVNYPDQLWKGSAFTSTGCREIRLFIEGQCDLEELKELWTRREVQYAKRQLTWWKKHLFATSVEGFKEKQKVWFNLAEVDHPQIIKMVFNMVS